MKPFYAVFLFIFLFLAVTGPALAHCEVPCGIYDDEARTNAIAEHITTIEKAMKQITELGSQSPVNYNQVVRWVNTKEQHATDIQAIVSQYFLTQRIKSDAKDYEKKLASLHQMLVSAMQCKQTTDLANVAKLKTALKEFEVLYYGHTHRE